jgi:DNA repair and recombination protein RAD52|tara:strand:+ start:11053 stop:11673 length:621 start_codon:yes stop_codon:yes gene_type:complete
MNIEELKKPLDPRHVASRSQGGGQVSYIEGWHAIAEANRIFGFDGWTRETMDLRQLGEPYEVNGKWRVNYSAKVCIRVLVPGDFGTLVSRDGCGFGQGIDKDVGQAHESALKEAETDAMKRALMTFGNPFGLALYDKSRANVQAPPPPTISEEQRSKLALQMDSLNFPADRLLSVSKIKDLRDLPAAKFDGAMKWIADEAKKLENA